MKVLLLFCLLPAFLWGKENEETGLQLNLLAEETAIVPGKPFTIGLHIQHKPGYHTYWKNPGIIGLATSLTWELPEGFTASGVSWPYPELCDMAGHPCHGYTRDVVLLTTIAPPAETTATEFTLKANATWMCCARTCHPGNKLMELTLPVAKTTRTVPETKTLFLQARKETPKNTQTWNLSQKKTPGGEFKLTFTTSGKEQPTYFFSSDGQISSNHKQRFQKTTGTNRWSLTIPQSDFSPTNLKILNGVLKTNNGYHQLSAPSG